VKGCLPEGGGKCEGLGEHAGPQAHECHGTQGKGLHTEGQGTGAESQEEGGEDSQSKSFWDFCTRPGALLHVGPRLFHCSIYCPCKMGSVYPRQC